MVSCGVRWPSLTSVGDVTDFPTTAGTGLAGAIFPVTVEAALSRFGFRTTLRALAVGLFLLTFPLLKFVKPRIPPAAGAGRRRFDLSFLWSPVFLLFQLAGIMQGLGYFIPIVCLRACHTTSHLSRLTCDSDIPSHLRQPSTEHQHDIQFQLPLITHARHLQPHRCRWLHHRRLCQRSMARHELYSTQHDRECHQCFCYLGLQWFCNRWIGSSLRVLRTFWAFCWELCMYCRVWRGEEGTADTIDFCKV